MLAGVGNEGKRRGASEEAAGRAIGLTTADVDTGMA